MTLDIKVLPAPSLPPLKHMTLSPKKIMLVDDHAMFAETLGQYLRLMFKDFEIIVVTSAEKAREQSSRQNIDIVLIDLEMADCSGLTLLADFAAAIQTLSRLLDSPPVDIAI